MAIKLPFILFIASSPAWDWSGFPPDKLEQHNPALPEDWQNYELDVPGNVHIMSLRPLRQCVIAACAGSYVDYDGFQGILQAARSIGGHREVQNILSVRNWFATLQNVGRLAIYIRQKKKGRIKKKSFTKKLPHSYAFASIN